MSIKKYKDRNGNVLYKVRVYLGKDPITKEPIRKQESGFKTKKEAEIYKLELLKTGKIAPTFTFNDICNEWLNLYKASNKESSYLNVKGQLTNHVASIIGEIDITKIGSYDLQKIFLDLSTRNSSFKKTFNYTNNVFEYAEKMKIIDSNPCYFVILPRKSTAPIKRKKQKFWTAQDAQKFLQILDTDKSIGERWCAFFRLIALSGMRRGELIPLEWKDIDFDNKRITVNKIISVTENNRKNVDDGSKTEAGVRVVDVDDKTLLILKKWRKKQNRVTKIVFTNDKNDYFCDSYPAKVLYRILKKHDLPLISLHGFRHTHCSLLFAAGVSVKEVQERVGHKDYTTTMNIYTHLSPEQKAETVNKLTEFLAQ